MAPEVPTLAWTEARAVPAAPVTLIWVSRVMRTVWAVPKVKFLENPALRTP